MLLWLVSLHLFCCKISFVPYQKKNAIEQLTKYTYNMTLKYRRFEFQNGLQGARGIAEKCVYLPIAATDDKRAALHIYKLNILLVKLRAPAFGLLPHSTLINAPW
jgi:hypothetical protein